MVASLTILLTALLAIMTVWLPSFSADFHDFYMAGQLLGRGESPYGWARFYSPIWVAAGFVPLTLLPERLAYAVHTLVSLAVIAWSVHRLTSGKRRSLALVTTMLLWLIQILWGNFDWVALGALAAPAPMGVWLALSKPQLGWILAAILLLAMPRRQMAGVLVAVTAGLALSYALGMRTPALEEVWEWNIAPWPWGLLAGVPLAAWSLAKRDRALALSAALLVSPYWQRPSFMAGWPSTIRSRWLWAAWFVVAAWMVVDQIRALIHLFRA